MSKTKIVVVVVLVIIVLGGLWKAGLLGSFDSDTYKAVFLTNSQVYFGKVHGESNQFVRLTDIFYLQVQQAVQPKGSEPASQNLALIKLGDELHKPQDEMRINRDQILFIEDLKPDSQIVERITAFHAAQSGTPTPTPTP